MPGELRLITFLGQVLPDLGAPTAVPHVGQVLSDLLLVFVRLL